MIKGFFTFIREYHIIDVAIGFVMGAASNALAQSLVNDIIMPLFTPLIPAERWEEAVWQIGEISIRWGLFLSNLLRFFILAFVVYIIITKVFKEEIKKK